MKKYAYPRSEKLKQDKDFALLFKKGKWRTAGAVRLVFTSSDEVQKPKVGVSASKKLFKRSIDRNRVKRLLRAVYRHHKEAFAQKFGNQTLAMLFWISPELPPNYQTVEADFLKLL